ncbi:MULTISPECIES: antitoxin of toxin-antitoxin stability system [Rhizobium]|uniref:antitoxin of toxin-antitoxin stability system n=1 Tax=Rhizobium TaxID=379 RepID=UPI0019585EDC|nr:MULTISPECIES: antitoxin of toxin-antitoxin stability system [Rhizobium]MBM7045302.1 antitoxin of toxin-antitoxin stability system [Rhizobium lusitanum]
MPKQAVFEISLDPELHAEFLAAAESAHRPAAEIVSELLRDYVGRQHDEPAYEAFLREKVKIARASMRAGQGRSNEEVEATFSTLRNQLRSGSR